MGGREIFPLDRDCEDHVYCIYEFPGPDYEQGPEPRTIGVTYSSINGNGFGGYGETVLGTKGTLSWNASRKSCSSRTRRPTPRSPWPRPRPASRSLDTTASGGGPAAAVGKNGPGNGPAQPRLYRGAGALGLVHPQSRSDSISRAAIPKVALGDAVIALTTNIAIRENRRIEFKHEWFDIDSDETPEGIKPDVARWS